MLMRRFHDREDAGRQLAQKLSGLALRNPLVLAIPRGGIEVAAPIARALNADLDVVLSRKLRDPHQPELALGAVSESGEVYLTEDAVRRTDSLGPYLEAERIRQVMEISRRRELFRAACPQAVVSGRSVIVTDDGIATGSTMIAALRTVRSAGAFEIIVAVPVASAEQLAEVRPLCDRLECLYVPSLFMAIGPFYRDFTQVSDARVVELLRLHAAHGRGGMRGESAPAAPRVTLGGNP
jgi:putative phosphoribosyl transferase